jgi:hypothetical protein
LSLRNASIGLTGARAKKKRYVLQVLSASGRPLNVTHGLERVPVAVGGAMLKGPAAANDYGPRNWPGPTAANATSSGWLYLGLLGVVSEPSSKSWTTKHNFFFVGVAIWTS